MAWHTHTHTHTTLITRLGTAYDRHGMTWNTIDDRNDTRNQNVLFVTDRTVSTATAFTFFPWRGHEELTSGLGESCPPTNTYDIDL